MSIFGIVILLCSGILIAVADGFLKQSAVTGNFWIALRTPWFFGSLILYFFQILLGVYYFMHHWGLGLMANVFVVFYSLISVVIGILFFEEKLSSIQFTGIALGLVSVFLMTK